MYFHERSCVGQTLVGVVAMVLVELFVEFRIATMRRCQGCYYHRPKHDANRTKEIGTDHIWMFKKSTEADACNLAMHMREYEPMYK